jgi:hypothetical protein
MKYPILFLSVFVLVSCSDIQNNKNPTTKGIDTNRFHYDISNQLLNCLPDKWTSWEDTAYAKKTYLAHIGKGTFDLHFKANYELEDTMMAENTNSKKGKHYFPEIILHFYPKSEQIKEAVKFTTENPLLVSNIHFAEYFGETEEFLIYECSTEKQLFQPADPRIIELRICILEKLKSYNSKK